VISTTLRSIRCLAGLLLLAAHLYTGSAFAAGKLPDRHAVIYFGMASGTGEVSEAQWSAYLEDTFIPRFPSFTVLRGEGVFRGVSEPARVVELRLPQEKRSALIEAVRVYVERFAQEGVLINEYGGVTSTVVTGKSGDS
jgi:hypothetical protein